MQTIPIHDGAVGWILFHDLAYSPQSLASLERALSDAGARVVIASLPGEGKMAEEYRAIPTHDYIRAARTQTMNLFSQCRDVIVMGHGMGALLALQMAEEMPVRAAVLAAPTLALPTKFVYFSGILSRFAPYQPHRDESRDLPTGFRDKGIPTAGLSAVHEMARRVLSDLASVRCPVRILVPQEDAWSDPAISRKLAEAIARGKSVELPAVSHQCLTGDAGQRLAEYCLELHRRICQKEEEHA